jgi:hypothetical protein
MQSYKALFMCLPTIMWLITCNFKQSKRFKWHSTPLSHVTHNSCNWYNFAVPENNYNHTRIHHQRKFVNINFLLRDNISIYRHHPAQCYKLRWKNNGAIFWGLNKSVEWTQVPFIQWGQFYIQRNTYEINSELETSTITHIYMLDACLSVVVVNVAFSNEIQYCLM